MKPCASVEHINDILFEGFGGSSTITSLPDHALASDHGCMLFWRVATGVYNVTLCFRKDWGGAYAKAEIREGFEWLFLSTDAIVVMGAIDKSNAACLAMVPHTLGVTLADKGDFYEYRATIAKWAKAYGGDAAVTAINKAGYTDKAQRLARALQ